MAKASDVCEPERMDSEDYLFMLYTSGSTGKPKGIAHSTAGYLLYALMTQKVNINLSWGFSFQNSADWMHMCICGIHFL
jgi:acetyl-CoA synthetase